MARPVAAGSGRHVFATTLGPAQRDRAGAPVDVVEAAGAAISPLRSPRSSAQRTMASARRADGPIRPSEATRRSTSARSGLRQRSQLPVDGIGEHADQRMHLDRPGVRKRK